LDVIDEFRMVCYLDDEFNDRDNGMLRVFFPKVINVLGLKLAITQPRTNLTTTNVILHLIWWVSHLFYNFVEASMLLLQPRNHSSLSEIIYTECTKCRELNCIGGKL
jgi:hypothetical protein